MGKFIPLCKYRCSQHHGFTLIELMVTVAILGILASLAAPAFTDTIKKYQSQALADELASSIEVARSEARRRGRNVLMGPFIDTAADCPTPAANHWQCWQLWWVDNAGAQ
jgi:type IV fimbrial biogenesis protein FimT